MWEEVACFPSGTEEKGKMHIVHMHLRMDWNIYMCGVDICVFLVPSNVFIIWIAMETRKSCWQLIYERLKPRAKVDISRKGNGNES